MNKKCRTCSRKDQFEGISVNAISGSHQEPIYLMLIYCTQLQYSTDDKLPQQICPECLALLDGAFAFWKQSRQTDANFRYGVLNQLVASSVVEDPPVPALAVKESSSNPQNFWCCFRKCPKVTTSLTHMEQHAKLDHFTARVANEVLRVADHKVVCSVCCAGFKSLGSYEFHRMTLLGSLPKLCTSASVGNERQQHDDEPMDDLGTGEITVVKEELDLDGWSENKEESGMVFDVEEAKIDEDPNETMDETALEEQGNALFDILMMKLAEAFAKAQDHFQIPLTSKEYLALRERGLVWRRFKKAAISRYKKWMRLIIICDRCKFQTNVYTTMQRHTKKRACAAAPMLYALTTYETSVKTFVCVPCGYQTHDSYNIRRHQRLLGHEGIDMSRYETPSKPDAAKEISTSSPMQLDIVSVKDEPCLSEDDESSLDTPSENGQERFDCVHCGTEIYSEAEKQRHLVCECPVLHSKDARYTCEHCKSESFPTVKDLKSHMRSTCPALQDKPVISRKIIPKECEKCNKIFATSELLSRHTAFCTTTTTEKDKEPFTCASCGIAFTVKYNFERHIKLRACLKDPNQCKNCFTTFPEASALKRHRKVGCPALLNAESNGIKITCNCDRCGKGFVTKRMLRLHKLTDGCGERRAAKPVEGKFQCPYCFAQLCRPCNLKRHLEAHCVVLLKKQAEAEHAAAQDTTGTNVPVAANTGET